MEILWQDRKRTFLGLPLSFTKYILTEKYLLIRSGVFTTTEDEVRLYRIIDVTLRRGFGQRLLGIGSIICHSSDETMKKFEIRNIKRSRETKEMLSELIETQRRENRVFNRESISLDEHDCGSDDADGSDEV